MARRLRIRSGSTSTPRKAPPAMTAASGWAPPMPPRPPETSEAPAQRAAEVLAAAGGEGLVGALQDPLGADVDPGAGGHLAEHHQPALLEAVEVLPGGPGRHQVGVGDEHPRRLRVGAHHPDRLAGLDQQALLLAQGEQRLHDPPRGRRVAGRLPGAAVDHQLLGQLGHLGVEVVQEHAQRRLGLPRAGVQRGAARGAVARVGGELLNKCRRARGARWRARGAPFQRLGWRHGSAPCSSPWRWPPGCRG